jgi:hypothetical protein
MEKLDQDINPVTGLKTTTWFDHEGVMHVDYQQDSEQAFEAVRRRRNDGEAWRKGVKSGFVHALHIPDGVLLELRKIGVDVLSNPAPSYAEVVVGLKKIHRFEACDTTGKQLV